MNNNKNTVYILYIYTHINTISVFRILRIHETSPILGERISAIILTQQRKQ